MSDEAPSEDPRVTAIRQSVASMEEERRNNQEEKEQREVRQGTLKERLKNVVADYPEADDTEKKDRMVSIQLRIDDQGRGIDWLRNNIIDLNRRILNTTPMIAQMAATIARMNQQQRDMDAAGQSGKSPKKKKGTKKKKKRKKKRKKRKGSKKKKKTVRRKKK